jgi:ankyrin repeat protein
LSVIWKSKKLNSNDVFQYCNNGTETPLHHAVKKREHAIAQKLLAAGAGKGITFSRHV